MAVRAEVGWLPWPAGERVPRAAPVVTERAAAASLLPRARAARRAAAAAFVPRRRDRDRTGWRTRLRRDADEAASRREPRAEAVRGDPRDLRRVRPARLGRCRALAGAPRRTPRGSGEAGARLRPVPLHRRPRRGARVARLVR